MFILFQQFFIPKYVQTNNNNNNLFSLIQERLQDLCSWVGGPDKSYLVGTTFTNCANKQTNKLTN